MAELIHSDATVDAIALLALQGIEPKVIEGVPHVVLHEEQRLENLAHLLPAPASIEEHITLSTAKSFIDYYQIFGGDSTLIFADESERTIRAVFDYHQPDKPAWKRHTATLKLEYSDEFLVWTKSNASTMPQRKFAEFVEEHIKDVLEPAGADLLEVAKTLTATKKLNFRSGQEISNGQVQLTYHEEINGSAGPSGNLNIPTQITIGLRVFKGMEGFKVPARLRYRIQDDAGLVFSYHLNNLEKIREEAFKEVYEQIRTGCQGRDILMA